METVVCGIDPGLRTTGYAILASSGSVTSVVDAGVCRFDVRPPMAERLRCIHVDLSAILAEHRPQVIAIEELYAHYKHPRTAILMGHARGVMLLAAAETGCDVRSYAATRVKRLLTGNGRATKEQMQRAVQHALHLDALPEPNDVADALALALCCAAELTHQPGCEVLS